MKNKKKHVTNLLYMHVYEVHTLNFACVTLHTFENFNITVNKSSCNPSIYDVDQNADSAYICDINHSTLRLMKQSKQKQFCSNV